MWNRLKFAVLSWVDMIFGTSYSYQDPPETLLSPYEEEEYVLVGKWYFDRIWYLTLLKNRGCLQDDRQTYAMVGLALGVLHKLLADFGRVDKLISLCCTTPESTQAFFKFFMHLEPRMKARGLLMDRKLSHVEAQALSREISHELTTVIQRANPAPWKRRDALYGLILEYKFTGLYRKEHLYANAIHPQVRH